MRIMLWLVTLCCSSALTLAACGGSTGDAQIFIAAEGTISQGIDAGTGPADILDGWTVRYDKYLVAVGNFRAGRSSSPGAQLADPRVVVLNLPQLPTSGYVFTQFRGAAATRWNQVSYDLPNATASAERGSVTTQADYDLMVQNNWSLYFEATLTNPGGQSCRPATPTDCVPRTSLRVRWGVKAGTSFGGCAPAEGDTGFAIPTGGTVQVKPTIHGDHWFFDNITEGVELTQRYAQWIIDSDLDRDGETTISELRNVRAAEVFPSSRYNLSGALIPVNTAYDWLEAQARTLGDFQGDGECSDRRILP